MPDTIKNANGEAPARRVGTLYVVGTPIGNLEDITLRALGTLKSVDLIACEDTRRTQKLLQHYQIPTPTTSYHEHNELTKAAELILRLEEGASVALVSDAGMPGISDPGYRLISLSIRHRIPVVPIPGASAFVAALVASGLPTDAFRFFGFLPAKAAQRRKLLEEQKTAQKTLIFYEAPHRILEALKDVLEVLGSRHVVLAREVTKVHEEFLRGRTDELLAELKKRKEILGEITLMIGRASEEPHPYADLPLRSRVEQIMRDQQVERMDALKVVAKERGISKSQAYREYEDKE